MSTRSIPFVASAAAVFLIAGCDQLPPEWRTRLRDSLIILTGTSPAPEPSSPPDPAQAPSGDGSSLSSELARRSKANAELLQEMFRVVFMREPRERSEFGSYVDSLNQGASLEGVYNGFTHSSEYRKIEMANMNASPEALKTFARELALLQAELPEVTQFDEKSAQPLAAPVQVGADPAQPEPERREGGTVVEFGKKETGPEMPLPGAKMGAPSPVPVDVKALTEKYVTLFIGASIYTLKRVLCDEALKVIAVKKEYKEKLALWYSKWAARTAGLGVDFGLAQRNNPDEKFHYKWSLEAGEDRTTWEVLNRLHRILNEANRQKQ